MNSNDPEKILAMLKRARTKWEAMSKADRLPGEDEKLRANSKSWGEKFYPKDGLVLRVNTRDLPRPEGSKGRKMDAFNEDFAWFKKSEAAQFVPENLTIGSKRQIPDKLIRRIVMLNLVDNVRGETIPYEDKHVSEAVLTSEVKGLDASGRAMLHFEGATKATATGAWPVAGFRDMHKPTRQKRGFETKMLGTATWDPKTKRFTKFELVALGTRYGGTQYNNRSGDFDPAPIGATFTLASDKSSDRVPPANYWMYGWW